MGEDCFRLDLCLLDFSSYHCSFSISGCRWDRSGQEDISLEKLSRNQDDLSQQEDNDPPKEYDPGQFAGLLHGSSPACESPENPFHLYGKRGQCEESQDEVSLANSPLPFKQTPIENNSEPVVKKIKPKVVSRTIFHKKSNQLENHTIVGTRTTRSGSRSGDQWAVNTGGFVERACTLGRIRSLPKALIDMHLSKTVSKSDSDLITHPSKEKASRVNWSETSTAEHSSKGNSERTPSFTSEWEEIDKIMNSIDVGINSELEEMNGESTRPRCPVQTVGQWLESIGLPQYENHLMANGFDNVQFMGSNVMEDQDLLEIGILNSGHRQRILQAIQLLPKMRPIGHDGYHPTSVAEWLDSIELGDYTKAFLINGYTSMDLLKKIWEVELINVHPTGPLTHDAPSYVKVLLLVNHFLKHMHYLGSMLIKELRGTESTQDACAKMRNLAYEIILTLGQAFEVAYQLALQARKGGHSSTLPESFENKPSKPIPKPRVSIRKSVNDLTLQFKALEKEEQSNTKSSRRQERVKSRAEINEIETKETIKKKSPK
ncbi:Ankyrin repeat and sterile alpha motif domain-containing protein 1B [Sciurus carolinensis]|uniref:Ankyrin repeat and sterile alpha motif domain-containing protein 1B n=1 Tax=Sciurus carolinensis TaxID=30640 RepID=A0AA41NJE0_SCICA|nr:Ankyrin repeat and sterile alpha motif domain-containing protein 1B [Sciurus carolinensis]